MKAGICFVAVSCLGLFVDHNGDASFSSRALAERAMETPPGILAVQIRSQGFPCEKPHGAKRDAKLSEPDQAVWLLKCENASYRMRLTPGLPAKVERLD